MVITDSAKELILKVLQEDNKNVVKIEVVSSGCHGQLFLDTIISNDFELINDVPVQISEIDKEYLDNVTFDTKGGNLIFTLNNSCGGCTGCGSDDEGCAGCH